MFDTRIKYASKQKLPPQAARVLNCFALFIFTATLALFSGCVQKPETGIQLRFSTWGSAEEMAVIRQRIAVFEKQNPDIHIELLAVPENYFQKLHILAAGGLIPDVMAVNSLSFPVYAQNHLLKPLDADLNDAGKVLTAKAFYPAALQAFTWGGHLYAIPRDVSDLVVYVNQDRLKAAGIAVPSANWTLNDFTNIATKLSQMPNQFGVSFFSQPPLTWMPFVWSQGGAMFDATLQHFTLADPVAINALQYYADLRNKLHAAPTKIQSGSATMSQLFLQGNVAMLISGRWTTPVLRKQAHFHWDILPFPKGSSGSIVGIDASGYAMSQSTRYPQAAWTFIRFLSSADTQRAFAQSGLIVPARKDIAESKAFLSGDPQHAHYFLDAMSNGQPTHVPIHWDEIMETVDQALEPVFDGQVSAHDALQKVKPQVEALLKT